MNLFKAWIQDDAKQIACVELPSRDIKAQAIAQGLAPNYHLITDSNASLEAVNLFCDYALGSQFGAAFDYSETIDEQLTDDFFTFIGQEPLSIELLNDVAKALAFWTDTERQAARRIAASNLVSDWEELRDKVDGGDWLFYEDVSTDIELGRKTAPLNLRFESIPKSLRDYFDYDKFGRDYRSLNTGEFIDGGWIEVW